MRTAKRLAVALALLLSASAAAEPARGGSDWPHYGNDPGGMRYAALEQITPANVGELEVAWVAHTGDVADGKPPFKTTSAFQLTPVLVDGTLYACTPFDRVLALDPATGAERWAYDPGVDKTADYANQFVCRGVSTWLDPQAEPEGACVRRVFVGTVDARLIALDAATGRPCEDFGSGGEVDLAPGVGAIAWKGEYSLTSPPAVAGDLVIVGSAVGDNQRTQAPSGGVRAYDARSGALRWAWDLAPPDLPPPQRAAETGYGLSTPNVWAPMSVDPERDLLFVPTGNPTPDYASGHRKGLDHFGSSVVALRASTGEVLWHFQTVHHDLWDFDVPAQPTLFPLRRGDRHIPALVQATKMGLLFTLHRESGEPLFPIEERPVPQGAEEGYVVSPTQPFPVKPPPLVPHTISPDDAWGLLLFDRWSCRKRLEALRYEGIYTPPSLRGTLMYPGNSGGSNWGGVAVDPQRQLLFANVMDVPWSVTLLRPEDLERSRAEHPDAEHAPQQGTPFAMRREMVLSPLGVPCNPPPWGVLHAVDLASGDIRWSVPFGTIRDIAGLPITLELGIPNLGGPLATASGLVFLGAAMDNYFRAFEAATGELLWRARLPASPQATPMSYLHDGRQYVVIAAGGHGRAGTKLGDAIVAFSLPH